MQRDPLPARPWVARPTAPASTCATVLARERGPARSGSTTKAAGSRGGATASLRLSPRVARGARTLPPTQRPLLRLRIGRSRLWPDRSHQVDGGQRPPSPHSDAAIMPAATAPSAGLHATRPKSTCAAKPIPTVKERAMTQTAATDRAGTGASFGARYIGTTMRR